MPSSHGNALTFNASTGERVKVVFVMQSAKTLEFVYETDLTHGLFLDAR